MIYNILLMLDGSDWLLVIGTGIEMRNQESPTIKSHLLDRCNNIYAQFFRRGRSHCCMHATVTFSDFSAHLINITADTLIIWEICRTTGWAWSTHLRLKYQQSPASYIHIYRFLGLMPNNMQTWIWYRFMSYSKHRLIITKTFSNNK